MADSAPSPRPDATNSTGVVLQPLQQDFSGGNAYIIMSAWRKYAILAVVSWMTLVATFSSTAVLIATPEIAAEFRTSAEALNASNAGVIMVMGLSSLIWSPLSDIFGRRLIYNIAIFFACVPSIGAAVARDMVTFTTMRILCGLTGTYFMVAGQIMIADIFEPVKRGKATGLMMVGTVAGPALGPCVGGIVITFSDWRGIFWVQAAMSGLGLLFSLIFIPTIRVDGPNEQPGSPRLRLSFRRALAQFSPIRVLRHFGCLNILLADLTCGFLAVTQYGLLASIRHILNPRFHMTTPLISGLFYIAPGLGFFVGSVLGGRFSDRTVIKYMEKRGGVRVPQDRLNSGISVLFLVLPISMMLFGWSLQHYFGGLALPIIAAFWIGIGIMGTFNALNTFTAEIRPDNKAEVVCSKYILQYAFGAISTGTVVSLVQTIGVGWSFTFCKQLRANTEVVHTSDSDSSES